MVGRSGPAPPAPIRAASPKPTCAKAPGSSPPPGRWSSWCRAPLPSASDAVIVAGRRQGDTSPAPRGAETEEHMPLYMDVHRKLDGLTAAAVAGAHQKDLEVQSRYGVRYIRYWFNEADGTVFCLAEAPSTDAAERVHREAHGLVADEIVEVQEGG